MWLLVFERATGLEASATRKQGTTWSSMMARAYRRDGTGCDVAYSSDKLRRTISHQNRAEPIINANRGQTMAAASAPQTAAWKMIYNRRTAVERTGLKQAGFIYKAMASCRPPPISAKARLNQ